VSSSSCDGSHFASPNVLFPSFGRGGATWYVIGSPSGPSFGDDAGDGDDDDVEATRGARATRGRRSTTRRARGRGDARVVDAGESRARMVRARSCAASRRWRSVVRSVDLWAEIPASARSGELATRTTIGRGRERGSARERK